MKKHVDELTLAKDCKRIVEGAAREYAEASDSRESFSQSPWKKSRPNRSAEGDDLFALPSTPVKEK